MHSGRVISGEATGDDIKPHTTEQMISDLLRSQLGFDGILISPMNITNTEETAAGEGDIFFEALYTGQTMFILPEILDDTIPLLDFLNIKALSGNIQMESVNTAIRKILTAKHSLNLDLVSEKRTLRSMAGMGLPEYYQNSRDISTASVTLLKNGNNIIPVDDQNRYIVSIVFLDDVSSNYSTMYEDALQQINNTIRCINIFGTPEERTAEEAVRRAGEAHAVICSFFLKPNADPGIPLLSSEQRSLIDRICQANDRIIGISFFDPSLINYLPDVGAFAVTYSPSQYSIDAAADVIFGRIDTQGRLPVKISEEYPTGFGLHISGDIITD